MGWDSILVGKCRNNSNSLNKSLCFLATCSGSPGPASTEGLKTSHQLSEFCFQMSGGLSQVSFLCCYFCFCKDLQHAPPMQKRQVAPLRRWSDRKLALSWVRVCGGADGASCCQKHLRDFNVNSNLMLCIQTRPKVRDNETDASAGVWTPFWQEALQVDA